MRRMLGAALSALVVSWLVIDANAVTRVPSKDGQFWDIQDTSSWSQDSGGIATGGGANPFNGWEFAHSRFA